MTWERDWFLRYPIAHRGLHLEEGPLENSMDAFSKAIEAKLPIELDVHLLIDGTVLVFHDESFERMTGVEKEVEFTPYEETLDMCLLGTEDYIPTLKEVLELVKGEVPLVIELKCYQHDGKLEKAVLSLLENYDGDYCIQSFNPFTLNWFKKNAPEIPRGLLSGSLDNSSLNWWKKFLLRSLIVVPWIRPSYVAFEWDKLWYPSVFLLRLLSSIPLIAWCPRSQEEYEKVAPKVDNIIFEFFSPVKKPGSN